MTTELDDAAEAFTAARGNKADGKWAETAVARMVLDGVRTDAAEPAVRELADVVRDSGESPEELFGEPREWARERIAGWREEGADVFTKPIAWSPRDLIIGTFGMAAVLSMIWFVLGLFSSESRFEVSPATVSLTLFLAAASMGFSAVYERLRRRMVLPKAILAGGVITIVVVTAFVAGVLFPLHDSFENGASSAWFAAVAVVCGAIAWALSRLWPEPDPHPVPSLDDATWFEQLTGDLRSRNDMTDARVDTVVAEARAHLAETGRPAAEEFGSPAAYARSFGRDEVVAARRSAWLYTLGGLAVTVGTFVELIDEGWRGIFFVYIPLGLSALYLGARRWTDVRRARR